VSSGGGDQLVEIVKETARNNFRKRFPEKVSKVSRSWKNKNQAAKNIFG